MGQTASPGINAYQNSIRLEFPELMQELTKILGAKLVAYIGNVRETRAVREWCEGKRVPSQATQASMRFTYHVAELVRESNGERITQNWFQGMNPHIQDQAPARLIREGATAERERDILDAARAFARLG